MNKNNKIFVIFSVVIVVILLLIFYLLLSIKSEQVVEEQNFIDDKNDDVLVDMKNQNQEAILRAEKISSVMFRQIDEFDHVLGDDGVIDVVFYGDYDDDFSGSFNEILKKAIKEFDGKIKLSFRHFPQRQHMNSFKMALSSECAAVQGKFWEMHEELFSLKAEEGFDYENLMIRVSKLGLDVEKFDKCFSDEEYKDKILNQISEARSFSIIGTPTTFVNDKILTGVTPWEDFVDSAGYARQGIKSVIEGELKL